ncbi:MAG TPA: hypothetical protein VGK19_08910 [Capsulimonadaceae bacterium]
MASRRLALTRMGRSVAKVGGDSFGNRLLEDDPKQRQYATIGMTGWTGGDRFCGFYTANMWCRLLRASPHARFVRIGSR